MRKNCIVALVLIFINLWCPIFAGGICCKVKHNAAKFNQLMQDLDTCSQKIKKNKQDRKLKLYTALKQCIRVIEFLTNDDVDPLEIINKLTAQHEGPLCFLFHEANDLLVCNSVEELIYTVWKEIWQDLRSETKQVNILRILSRLVKDKKADHHSFEEFMDQEHNGETYKKMLTEQATKKVNLSEALQAEQRRFMIKAWNSAILETASKEKEKENTQEKIDDGQKKAAEIAKLREKQQRRKQRVEDALTADKKMKEVQAKEHDAALQVEQEKAKDAHILIEKQKKADELKRFAAQQAAAFNRGIAEAVANKITKKESELETIAQQFQLASRPKKLRNAFLEWHRATKSLMVADSHHNKRVQKHSFELWKKAFERRKKMKEEKIAQENAQKRAQEELDRGLRHHFEKHIVKKASDYLNPLIEAERVATMRSNNYLDWFDNHCDSLIYGAAYNYLFNKSTFKTNKPKIKIDCALCDSLIDKNALVMNLQDLHWSDLNRSRKYQLVNQQLRAQAFAACAAQQQ
jgi:hypothetical protein